MIGWLNSFRSRGQREINLTELIEALQAGGCPVCRLVNQSEARYLRGLLHEGVSDPDIRDRIRETGGFCAMHGGALAEARDNLPVAIYCHDLIHHLLGLLVSYQDKGGSQTLVLPSPHEKCRVCSMIREVARRYLQALLDLMDKEDGMQLLQQAGGLCLPHLGMAISVAGKDQRLGFVIEAQRQSMESLSQELAEFIRKKDYRYASEPYGREGDSWLRALRLLSGISTPAGSKHGR